MMNSRIADLAPIAAENFLSSLQAIQEELFFQYLRLPRVGETIVFQRYETQRYLFSPHDFTRSCSSTENEQC